MDIRSLGDKGENIAVKLLKQNNYKILETNYYTRFGEIDIIAQDGDTLVFVEVKTRRNTKYGQPEKAVTERKIRHIKRVSELFCKNKTGLPVKKRIDIVSIIMNNNRIKTYRIIKID